MRPGLASEVSAALIRLGGEAIAREIATDLAASVADVTVVLRDQERFSGPWTRGRVPHTRKVYSLVSVRQAAAGGWRWPRVKPHSQNASILDVLADRRFHTTSEIHRRAGFSRLNSRIAELNGRGYRIEHRGEGGGAENHEYRLCQVPLDETTKGAPDPAAFVVSSSSTGKTSPLPPDGADGNPPPVLLSPEQLSLPVAA